MRTMVSELRTSMNLARPFQRYTPSTAGASNRAAWQLSQVRDFLGRQWRPIALATAFALVLGVSYLAVAPPRYTAKLEMIIDTDGVTWSQSELPSKKQIVEDALVESKIEATQSESVILSVIRRLHLNEDPEFIGNDTGLMQRFFSFLELAPAVTLERSNEQLTREAVKRVKGNLEVTRLGLSYVDQIAFTSLDPDKAANIANAFADAYVEDQLQAKFEATQRAGRWLEQRMGELRQQASDAYREVQDYKSNNGIIINVDGKLASETELDQLGIALAKARADTSRARAKLERVTRVLQQRTNKATLEIPDPIVTDALSNPVITKLQQQFFDDQNKESAWSARYGADHEAARKLRAEMAAVQHAIWDEISRIAESYESELQITKSQEESIDRRMVEVFQHAGQTRQSQVRLRELETAANSYRGIFHTFLLRFTQSVQQQSFPSTEARVISFATPGTRSSPKIQFTLLLASLCGLGVGIMAAFGRELISRQIRTRAQLETLLGTSCLAVIPSFASRLSTQRKKDTTKGTGAFRKISEVAPFSATAEALRSVKVAIDLNAVAGNVIGIVSALPGEGKTTIAASFAAFVAKSGARTLLIDGDLRNPSMSNTLGYTNYPGLLELVANNASAHDLVIYDQKYKFDFLPSSAKFKPSNSSDILNSPAVKEMLKLAANDYDYVLVDLPPILAVVDVKAAAHLFDAFVLVVAWGSTSTDDVVRAVAASNTLSEKLIGTVLNKANLAVMRSMEGNSARMSTYYTDEALSAEK
jgi:succinoglycan biosynthesis transport protein ExoP